MNLEVAQEAARVAGPWPRGRVSSSPPLAGDGLPRASSAVTRSQLALTGFPSPFALAPEPGHAKEEASAASAAGHVECGASGSLSLRRPLLLALSIPATTRALG